MTDAQPMGGGIVPPPPETSKPAIPRVLLLGIGVAAACIAAILFTFNPSTSGFYPFCLFHATTGLLCPGCGSLRAMHQLLHGRIIEAWHCNALLVLAIPIVGGVWLRRCLGPRTVARRQRLSSIHWLWLAAAVVLGFALLRNLPLAAATWFRPQ